MEKHRIVLFVAALVTGGLLGKVFLADAEWIGWLLFAASCVAVGAIFFRIDEWFRRRKRK